ncbi:two-component sensor histidine kinase [Paractinoplanes abujensis]|uniref:histidine kinase n=1 Tax=Paractinoplanes abujensis TaxID=882441 RepID=A0A7W7CKW3_9ACTN|nr:HAMP domain-containing sensor histidine kinase [Actinoplanes abujensis]MBB4690432.1 two-component system OmpR family sensor kinase [Actinoplanes abujensis]GID21196.1 two-component sensor histidine kinase [Actinoplanes abujensis]
MIKLSRGNWTRLRRWRQWTLRSRLVLVVAALAALGLLVANAAGLVLIRSYLQERIDDQLRIMAGPLSQAMPESGEVRRTGQVDVFAGPPAGGGHVKILGPDQLKYLFVGTGLVEVTRITSAGDDLPAVPTLEKAADSPGFREPYTVVAADGSEWRMIAVRNDRIGGFAVGGVSLVELHGTIDRLLLTQAAVSVLVLALLGLGAAFVVRLGLRPLNDMERLATDISAGNLSGRVTGADPHTEPGRLGLALNSMLGRIEAEVSARTASESRMRQFLADASHELRTPLTSIKGFAELHRRGGVAPGPALDRIESEAGRMSLLVEDMLMLARLDQQRPLARKPVDLLEVAVDTVRDAHARAPERVVHLAGLNDDEDTFEPPTVLGDEHALRQIATNLVANALQHTPPEAEVTVRVGWSVPRPPEPGAVVSGPPSPTADRLAVLEVSDTGPGIPDEHAPRVFERLYRADSSRYRGKGGGSGLGLSIVAAFVHGHGGWVELEPSPGGGATFRVLLPT